MLNYITKNKRKIIGRPEMLKKLLKVEGLNRKDITVYSSWRSLEEQKTLVKTGKSKTLNSNHRRGVAVDIIGWDKVEKEMRKNGMINDITWDRNHFVLGGEIKGTTYGLIDALPKILEEYKPVEAPVSVPEPVKTYNATTKVKTLVIISKDKQFYIEPTATLNVVPAPDNSTLNGYTFKEDGTTNNTFPKDKQFYIDKQTYQMVDDIVYFLKSVIKNLWKKLKTFL